jgi:hypothetical protein
VRVADRRVSRERAVAAANAAGELRVIARDAAVEDVNGDALASPAVAVRPIQRQSSLVDPIEGEGERARLENR